MRLYYILSVSVPHQNLLRKGRIVSQKSATPNTDSGASIIIVVRCQAPGNVVFFSKLSLSPLANHVAENVLHYFTTMVVGEYIPANFQSHFRENFIVPLLNLVCVFFNNWPHEKLVCSRFPD